MNIRLFPIILAAVSLLFSLFTVGEAEAGILDLSEAEVVESSIHGGNPVFLGANAFDNDPGTRWAGEFPNTEQWVHVDLGEDVALEKITIDWETANATDFQILMRTAAQGPDDDPASWTPVATVTGAAGLPGGGALGDDHEFNFLTNEVVDLIELGIEEATIDVTNPVGRYLMIATTDYSTTCCGGPSIWEVVVEAGEAQVEDTDEDGIPDFWEEENGLDSDDPNDAALDGDSDGLSNLEEFNKGTDPAKDDTDEDGLLDGVESGTGTWVSAMNTGTNPSRADTDGDTLADGTENPDLPFTGANQPGTDPNIADTDGDGFSDSVEIAQGSDPTDAQSPPPPLDLSGATVVESSIHGGNDIFVGRNAFDGEVGTRWAAEFTGGSEWVYVDLGEPQAIATVIIDWETANAAEYNLLIWEGGGDPSDDPADWTVVVEVTETAGLPGGGQRGDDHQFDFTSGTFTDVSAPGIGGTANFLITNPVTQYLMIDAFEFSGTCCNGASIWEVAIFPGAGGSVFQIIDIDYDVAVNEASITWNSFPGRNYLIETSNDLRQWTELDDGVSSEGDTTTFNDDGIPPGTTQRYYRVSDN
jgi:hypothetical protein